MTTVPPLGPLARGTENPGPGRGALRDHGMEGRHLEVSRTSRPGSEAVITRPRRCDGAACAVVSRQPLGIQERYRSGTGTECSRGPGRSRGRDRRVTRSGSCRVAYIQRRRDPGASARRGESGVSVAGRLIRRTEGKGQGLSFAWRPANERMHPWKGETYMRKIQP